MKIRYHLYQTLLLCFYFISGEIKFLFIYYKVPIDITLLFALLISLDIVYNLIFNQTQIRFTPNKLLLLFTFVSFYLLFFVSLFYTASEEYAYKKTTYFLLTILAFIYPLFIRNFDINLFAKVTLYWTLPASIWFIIVKHLYWSGYKDEIGEHFDPLLGAYAGLSINAAFLIFYFVENRRFKPVLFLILLMLALGSRGTLIFTFIVIFIFEYRSIWSWINAPRVKRRISQLEILGVILIFPVLFFFRNTIIEGFKFGLARFQSLLSFSEDNSSNERIELYEFSVDTIFESVNSVIFGHGIGSFGILFNGFESRTIPHNIYLEAWFELGVLGLILLIIITLFPLLLKNRNQIIKMMALFFLFDSMKSGGFDEMRFMFGIYGTLIFINCNRITTKFSGPILKQPSMVN